MDGLVAGGGAAIRESGLPYVAILGDELSPKESAWMRMNLPNARLEVWPGSGYFPHLAHPRRFAVLLAETGKWVVKKPGEADQAAPSS